MQQMNVPVLYIITILIFASVEHVMKGKPFFKHLKAQGKLYLACLHHRVPDCYGIWQDKSSNTLQALISSV